MAGQEPSSYSAAAGATLAAARKGSVDVDPDAYEGQPEMRSGGGLGAEGGPADLAPGGGGSGDASGAAPASAAGGRAASTAAAAAADGGAPTGPPTVLTKLAKWGDYESVGEPVDGTPLLPMKTPLAASILRDWALPDPPKHSLTVAALVEGQRARGRRVGCIVDLSNHECLYAEDLPEYAGEVEYHHLACVAKELPSRAAIQRVAAVVADFAARRPGELIAVHCAYGFNRTGFVVASLLCEHYGYEAAEAALDAFARARPPGVRHERFRDELRARYGGGGTAGSGGGTVVCGGGGGIGIGGEPSAAGPAGGSGSNVGGSGSGSNPAVAGIRPCAVAAAAAAAASALNGLALGAARAPPATACANGCCGGGRGCGRDGCATEEGNGDDDDRVSRDNSSIGGGSEGGSPEVRFGGMRLAEAVLSGRAGRAGSGGALAAPAPPTLLQQPPPPPSQQQQQQQHPSRLGAPPR